MTEKVIQRLAALKEDSSEYVRKSVGNALRDISKKFSDFYSKMLYSHLIVAYNETMR